MNSQINVNDAGMPSGMPDLFNSMEDSRPHPQPQEKPGPGRSRKILGLDLGVSSIGWALIREENDRPCDIMGMGVRIVPLDTDESDEFSRGNKISKNRQRTQKRTMRKGYYRYVLRRRALTAELKKHDMFDETLFNLPQLELWRLRAKAVTEPISLKELGRVLYHLNQKRGYSSSRISDEEEENGKKQKEYVAEILNRYQQLRQEGKTIGQKFYEELQKNPHYRTKQQVFPRQAYMDEFDAIMRRQQQYYPEVLTDDFIHHIRNEIIYFQRKLKSQKGLVSVCEFEGFYVKNAEGKEIFTGPKVAHRSNPLFQAEKIWEAINNISIKDKHNNEFLLTLEHKEKIFNYLDNHEKLTESTLLKLLGLDVNDGWITNKNIQKRGIQGNLTKVAIKKALDNKELEHQWLRFDLKILNTGEKVYLYDKDSGEVKDELDQCLVSDDCIHQPLYQLWHCIYSISDLEECKKALIKKFGFDDATAERLANIDFSKQGYGNKSVKAMRKLLPYLMKGYKYSDAAALAGFNHSNSLTSAEIQAKKLLDKIPLLRKNALRQPVVEKILNQMIHIVNDIIDENRGWVTKEERENGLFEIRVELARELKQSQKERNETFKNINKIEKENREIEKELERMGLSATRNNIIKYRLFHQFGESSEDGGSKKIIGICPYSGRPFSLAEALNGDNIDVDHIIPKSLLFDDSQHNKVLVYRIENQQKGDRTAFDYMASKGEEAFNQYKERVHQLYKKGFISKAKRDKLLTPADNIPKDFIARQLRETQYVAKKSRELLSVVARNVWSTSGNVTEYLRRIWGWNDVLHNLQMQRIKEIIPDPLAEGITEIVECGTHDGQKHKKEVIKGWTKRDDHRHHAIDALVVACTRQGFIQRLNTLAAKGAREELYKAVEERKQEFRDSLNLVDRYFISQKPFTTREVEEKAAGIIVSFKPGKKVATWGKRFVRKDGKRIVVQERVLVPRGPLSEESVYGKIKILERQKPVKYLFENPHLIFKPYIRELVEKRLSEYNGDVKRALKSLELRPIYVGRDRNIKLQYGTCFKEEYVIKYPLTAIKKDDVQFIIDKKVRELVQERLELYNYNEKEAFREPLFLDKNNTIPIRSVRMITGLSAVEPIRYDENGQPIAFVKPGNNHHMAIYINEKGEKVSHLCTFWHAVERKKYGLPIIIENPREVWEKILSNPDVYPQSFLEKLPLDSWVFDVSLQENEMFIVGLNYPIEEIRSMPMKELSKHIYRVQKLSDFDIYFRHQYETQILNEKQYRNTKKYLRISSLRAWENLNPLKIRVNRIGEIVRL